MEQRNYLKRKNSSQSDDIVHGSKLKFNEELNKNDPVASFKSKLSSDYFSYSKKLIWEETPNFSLRESNLQNLELKNHFFVQKPRDSIKSIFVIKISRILSNSRMLK